MADIEVRTTGAHVQATAGDRIVIRLREAGTTGYQWSVVDVEGPLRIESSGVELPPDLIPGAAGERVIVARPGGPGHGRVRCQLKRAWEQQPVDAFEVQVDVS